MLTSPGFVDSIMLSTKPGEEACLPDGFDLVMDPFIYIFCSLYFIISLGSDKMDDILFDIYMQLKVTPSYIINIHILM